MTWLLQRCGGEVSLADKAQEPSSQVLPLRLRQRLQKQLQEIISLPLSLQTERSWTDFALKFESLRSLNLLKRQSLSVGLSKGCDAALPVFERCWLPPCLLSAPKCCCRRFLLTSSHIKSRWCGVDPRCSSKVFNSFLNFLVDVSNPPALSLMLCVGSALLVRPTHSTATLGLKS